MIIEVIASNIGGTATLIGDPPNIIIAGATGLTSTSSSSTWRRSSSLTFAVVTAGLYLYYRSRLQIDPRTATLVMELDAAASIRDADELRRTVPVLIGTILRSSSTSRSGRAGDRRADRRDRALLVTPTPLEQALAKIEWPTLFFFVALFVMVGALEETGAIGACRRRRRATSPAATAPPSSLGILWIGGIGSAIVDNIPFTTAMIPVVERAQRRRRRRRLLVGARARRLLRRQRDDHRRSRQRRRRRD